MEVSFPSGPLKWLTRLTRPFALVLVSTYIDVPFSLPAPQQVLGLSSVPVAGDHFEVVDSLEQALCFMAGDHFEVVDSLDQARSLAEEAAGKLRTARLAALQGESKVSLSALAGRGASGGDSGESDEEGLEFHQLNVILKVDNQVGVSVVCGHAWERGQGAGPPAIGGRGGSDEDGLEFHQLNVILKVDNQVGLGVRVKQERGMCNQAATRLVALQGESKVSLSALAGRGASGGGVGSDGEGDEDGLEFHQLNVILKADNQVVAGLDCGVGLEGFDEWQQGDSIEAYLPFIPTPHSPRYPHSPHYETGGSRAGVRGGPGGL
ncbi:unnamed protein product [Closterium sp. NIES-54]